MTTMATVYLVGAGPGTADLLTLRASRLLAQARVIIYDALVDSSIHSLFAPTAELIYVGKRAGAHALSQEAINDLIVSTAERYTDSGDTIVRLKGGDPFVFGRGGEEMIALRQAGIAYEVVPGITAGIAAPAYAGIPVTHRSISRSVTLVTAFTKEEGLPPLDWQAYARLEGTLVFYMSMRVVPLIAQALMAHEMPPETPAVIISQGTRPSQRLLQGTLAELTPEAYDYEAYAPGLLVVGEVVGFAEAYSWYCPPPLAGQRILITRSEAQASALEDKLAHLGATPLLLPSIHIEPLPDYSEVDAVLCADLRPDWYIFTSPNGVDYLMHRLKACGYDARYWAGIQIASIGPATSRALEAYGLSPDFVPREHTAQGLARELALHTGVQPIRAINPTSTISPGDLCAILAEHGIACTSLGVYHNAPIDYSADELRELMTSGLDWITFCSSSAVHNFMALLHRHTLHPFLQGIRLAAIGRMTRATLESYGLSVEVCPERPSLEALAHAIALC